MQIYHIIKILRRNKKMAVNKVDYEVLTSGVSVYSNQAGALDDVINSLVQMNGQLQDGWTNQTADAFIERFENEYKPALENARDAIQSISDFIQNYMQNRQDDDAQGVSSCKRLIFFPCGFLKKQESAWIILKNEKNN